MHTQTKTPCFEKHPNPARPFIGSVKNSSPIDDNDAGLSTDHSGVFKLLLDTLRRDTCQVGFQFALKRPDEVIRTREKHRCGTKPAKRLADGHWGAGR